MWLCMCINWGRGGGGRRVLKCGCVCALIGGLGGGGRRVLKCGCVCVLIGGGGRTESA